MKIVKFAELKLYAIENVHFWNHKFLILRETCKKAFEVSVLRTYVKRNQTEQLKSC